MEIKGITSEVFGAIVWRVSETRYDENVTCDGLAPTKYGRGGVPRFNQRVIVRSSRGAGARRSWSGRRMPCACWHVFRDVVRATLTAHPTATFRTRMAHYTADNFESTYPATGCLNIGSLMQPAYMPDLCECSSDIRSDDEGGPRPGGGNYITDRLASVVPDTDLRPDPRWSAERDQALAIAASECAWCGSATPGSVFAWCCPECQELWQAKYGAGLARV
jgi:hypothetical protein